MSLLEQLKDAQKSAMKAKDKARLGTIRMVLAAIKQVEVDTRKELSDEDVTTVLTKQVKQRRDSIEQFESANRQDLADAEAAELAVLEEFLPKPLTEEEINALIKDAIEKSGAASMQEMGKVIGLLKPQMIGRADMGKVSQLVKANLS
ncbi:GatB/YqeY domain-containing protein [Algicola sagamiensis]|uniref:GatB/YqeY domain-containing protein n=1 Tax=Algicola sagamiensis TaxID=163869 RepID=UPI000380DAEE|nr:GatB/YqeY domain-containing protein [Algicola sagamiensis]